MVISVLLALLRMAISSETIAIGTWYISELSSVSTHISLGLDDNGLAVGDQPWIFEYGIDGTIELLGYKKYLSVDENDQLSLSDIPHEEFRLMFRPNSKDEYFVYHQGNIHFWLEDFYVIGDKGSDGALVTLTFIDIIEFCV